MRNRKPDIRFYTVAVLFSVTACSPDPGLLQEIKQSKQLIVVTRNAPTTYYELHDELSGVEYDMTQAFARSLGVKVTYLVQDTTRDILDSIQLEEAHIAAAGLTITEERDDSFTFGPIYQEVEQQVVCRRGGANPKQAEDLVGLSLEVPSGTSYDETLTRLQQYIPDLGWQAVEDADTETLLEKVWLKKLDCTIADSNIVAINRRYYPELRVRFDLTRPEPLAWAIPEDAGDLKKALDKWFKQFRKSGKLEALLERYYGHAEEFDYVDTRRFIRRINTVLPKYKDQFKAAARKYDLDWMLLAAQAYQESHWRTNARSPTGVRGIMMLTMNTARELNVKSRLDPVQSIHGGARYFKQLHDRIPEEVQEPDRTWFALAAYNVGMGHIYDARALAQRLGNDPNTWVGLSEVLPLLSQKKYYRTLKHGYARGREPVIYVQRIRDYHDILHQRLSLTAMNNGG